MTAGGLIRDLARHHRHLLALGLAAVAAVDLLQLYVPRLIKFAVDDLTFGRASASSLLHQAGAILGLAAAVALFRILGRPIFMGFGRVVERELRRRLFDHLQGLHLGYFSDRPPGELMTRATSDLNNIRLAAGYGVTSAVDALLTGGLALGFMLYISPLLTALAFLPMPLIPVITRLQSGRLHRQYTRVQESLAAMTEQVRETVAAIRVVKAYALAGRQEARLGGAARRHLNLNMTVARILALYLPLMRLLSSLSLAVVLGAGGPMAVLGYITIGDFVAFTAYLGMITTPLIYFGYLVNLMQRCRASLRRVAEVLSSRPEVIDPAEPLIIDPAAGRGVEVRDLHFSYPGAPQPALRGLSLIVPAKAAVAVVGPIASGKSTLLRLLGRLYDPPPGSIYVEGVDVLRARQADLRAYVVQVPQEAFLFSATVRDNLALGRPGAGEEELWAALAVAELDEEVRRLPLGLDTVLGEKGHDLSGGQRQRLTLARALLMDPPVLVLDDPLSAVDTVTEGRILKNLSQRRAGRSTLMVSHRLASVAFAETIFVLDEGRVKEQGVHDELMAARGLYQSLFAEQASLAELGG